MPTPHTINYLYIIVKTNGIGSSYEQRDQIKDAVSEYLVKSGLDDEYYAYDFVNKVRVDHDNITILEFPESCIQIGIARWKKYANEVE